MADSFTESTTTGWFSRIGNSIKGILIGIVLIVVSFPVLFMNEGRAVKTRKTLDQGSKECVHADAQKIESANEGKLIHLNGSTASQATLTDEAFRVTTKALKLKRTVEMYQWKENSSSESKKKLGGSETKTTTYTYEKAWVEGRLNSGDFKKPTGHENPSPSISSQVWSASPITLGAFTLSGDLVSQINNFTPHAIKALEGEPILVDGRTVLFNNGKYYIGKQPASPVIGDLRVSYQAALPGEVSVVSRQIGKTFESFTGKSGGTINMLHIGQHSAEAMFTQAQKSNKMMTWILRVVGFIVMFFGFSLVFKPLSVVADVLPIAGSIVGVGTGIVAFLLAAPLSLITIGVAWIFYRPLIGVPLLVLAGVGLFFLFKKMAAQKKASA